MTSYGVMDTENVIFDIAEEFIRKTSRTVFLTGKAGTGKTTFLRHIQETTEKKTVVVAPTGVAAINARGVTIHSFFQLPFTPFVPEKEIGFEDALDMRDQYLLLRNLKVASEKRRLYRELELLIIDEVSMVRCDVLDAMDVILRYVRRKPLTPFGGVQVLFIGDLFQLPPVVPDDQWDILKHYYEGPFFFQSRVLRHARPLYIELKKIYRQTDSYFIDLLNSVRNNRVTESDLAWLHSRYDPEFMTAPVDHFIVITTHNYQADKINAEALDNIPAPLFQFTGEITGDFPERNFPTDKILRLREGAQIMFIKNDTERVRRYYNGKIGRIKRIEDDQIVITFPREDAELVVTRDTWVNIRYTLNPVSHQVEEEILGTFTQFGIRLAWAITIHKSQGLTFERVIVDAGKAFAPGQVYVALSRCTTLEGIILTSRIPRDRINTDKRVLQFAAEECSTDELRPLLEREGRQHLVDKVFHTLDWTSSMDELEDFQRFLQPRKLKHKQEAEDLVKSLQQAAAEQHVLAQKFQEQLSRLVRETEAEAFHGAVNERIAAGSNYFVRQLEDVFLKPLLDHQYRLEGQSRLKTYRKALKDLIVFFESRKDGLREACEIARQVVHGVPE